MSKELSDTDSVNSEPNNSVYYVYNVHSESNIDEDCKVKSKLQHTNHMHDSRTNSLANTSHNTLQHNITNNIISTHYVNTVMDNTTNKDDIEVIELTPKDQEFHTLYVNTLDSDLNFNELAPTGKIENFVLINNQHFEEYPEQSKSSNSLAKCTNIAGKEAKPPKAPRFIFPLKDKVIPENLLIDKRSKIDKFSHPPTNIPK